MDEWNLEKFGGPWNFVEFGGLVNRKFVELGGVLEFSGI